MKQGKVKWFDIKKGYGFIAPEDGSKDVFVHRNNVENLGYNQGLEDGEAVEFEVEETQKGLSAVKVNSLDYK
jgi:CspA family cold shock protein